ncbi:hypothetical protein [Streptomyces chrestomyceticus]|uniref:hypothetical protein n=1 Tax=Streptomyces chrestomyceticus TaxID=68185 RepID=UPI0033DE2307
MISATPAPLVITGPLRALHAHPDGTLTVTPAVGPSLLLTGQQQAHAPQVYDGPTPAHAIEAPADTAEPCGCIPLSQAPSPAVAADVMQARAISHHLADLGVPAARRAVGWDDTHQAAAVRVSAHHGLYALLIPPVGRAFPVLYRSERIGALDARRTPSTRDSLAGTLYAAFLRDRGDL